jgi:hypothetical protein
MKWPNLQKVSKFTSKNPIGTTPGAYPKVERLKSRFWPSMRTLALVGNDCHGQTRQLIFPLIQ